MTRDVVELVGIEVELPGDDVLAIGLREREVRVRIPVGRAVPGGELDAPDAAQSAMSPTGQHRRDLMVALVGLSLGGLSQASDATGPAPVGEVRPVLVAFLSRSGNTRVVAGLIQRAFAGDVFEILPAVPYPDEYLATVERAREERDRSIEPALRSHVSDIARYKTVFLGFPIWGETAPPLIRSFLSAHDLAGKTVIPFITHGGYGLGNSEFVVARHAPAARLQPAFSMVDQQERQTMDRVNAWLSNLPASSKN